MSCSCQWCYVWQICACVPQELKKKELEELDAVFAELGIAADANKESAPGEVSAPDQRVQSTRSTALACPLLTFHANPGTNHMRS